MSKLFYRTEKDIEHEVNQDSYTVFDLKFMNDAPITCMAVADGMGGLDSGDAASRTAVSAFSDSFYLRLKKKYEAAAIAGKKLDLGSNHKIMENIIFRAVQDANRKVCQGILPRKQSGTTLSVAVILNSCLMVANVGDSPIYYYSEKDQEIRCVSRIMNRAEDNAIRGIWQRYSPEYFDSSNILTGSLGRFDEIEEYEGPRSDAAEKVIYTCKVGYLEDKDMVILGSDGAFGHLRPNDILDTILEERGQKKLEILFEKAADHVEDDRTAILYIQESR